MLFNSFQFIVAFLPICLVVYYVLQKHDCQAESTLFLVAASLFFFGYWNVSYVLLLTVSIIANYLLAAVIRKKARQTPRKWWLAVGVAFNLTLLGYYKYTNFLVDTLNDLSRFDIQIQTIVLPIGISFFTFQQVAYLVDEYAGRGGERNFFRYALFVSFFPQLIAGPIVHHREMMPQFARKVSHRLLYNLAVGFAVFSIGLTKKVMFADTFALAASPVFEASDAGHSPHFLEAWGAALGYTLQIYFDFSGYSDMAVGLGRMFGIRLPVNFASPYKANSIIDFWRRWHITLSRFLRDYLYFSLGGGLRGKARRYLNIFITMLLGGIWHGAGWTFVIWGALHGTLIVVNHLWVDYSPFHREKPSPARHAFFTLLTLFCVVLTWVPFRAETVDGMMRVYEGMAGLNGITLPSQLLSIAPGVASWAEAHGAEIGSFGRTSGVIGVVLAPLVLLALFFFPETHEIFARYRVALASPGYPASRATPRSRRILWRAGVGGGLVAGLLFALCISSLDRASEFIYFQF